MKKSALILVALTIVLSSLGSSFADDAVPKLLNFQGRVSVEGQAFSGTGQFKFVLVSLDGLTTYWSNDATSVNGTEPSSGIAVFVRDGIYSVVLGGSGMEPLPESVFVDNGDVSLCVWFSDNVHGFEKLEPNQRILSVGYALRASVADTVKDSGRTIITGELDSRDQGDEFIDILWKMESVWNGSGYDFRNVYTRFGIKNIPVADLDVSDMPMVNMYWAISSDSSNWYNNINSLCLFEGNYVPDILDSQYMTYKIMNNTIKLSYPHLTDRDDINSTPFISYISGSPSYNVFYKIVIMK